MGGTTESVKPGEIAAAVTADGAESGDGTTALAERGGEEALCLESSDQFR